jgi:hypothetical protein
MAEAALRILRFIQPHFHQVDLGGAATRVALAAFCRHTHRACRIAQFLGFVD